MAADTGKDLVSARVKRILPFRDSAAVLLEGGGKAFLIFIGLPEAMAIARILEGETPERPLTHELLAYVMGAFDIEVKKVVISSIVEGVFCATLSLEQKVDGRPAEELRIDARASDSIAIALRHQQPIWVTRRVLDEVEDVTEAMKPIEAELDEAEEDLDQDEGQAGEAQGDGPR